MPSVSEAAAGLRYVRAKCDDKFKHIYDIYVDFFGRSVYFFSIRMVYETPTISLGVGGEDTPLAWSGVEKLLKYIDSAADSFFKLSDAVRTIVYEFFREVKEDNYASRWPGYWQKMFIEIGSGLISKTNEWTVTPQMITGIRTTAKSTTIENDYRISYWNRIPYWNMFPTLSASEETKTAERLFDSMLEALRAAFSPEEDRKSMCMYIYRETRRFTPRS